MDFNMIENIPSNVKLVINPYDNYHSSTRKGIMVSGEWSNEVTTFILENEVKAVYLNYAKGWNSSDYSFLRDLKSVEELNVIAPGYKNFNSVEEMDSLSNLVLSFCPDEKVDFTRLDNLVDFSAPWWKGAESILQCTGLTDLSLDKLKLKNYESLGNLVNLKSFGVVDGGVNNVDWLRNLKELEWLEICSWRNLRDFSPISQCYKLKRLGIESCSSLNDVSFLSYLSGIKILCLSGNKSIPSIASMKNLKKLRAFSFSGTTDIEDGDLKVLETLPELSMLMFQGRKHYTHKLIKDWNWDNYNKPDRLLMLK